MNDQTMRFRVGLFILLMLALLGGLIVLFGGYPSLLKPHRAYYVVLTDASGIAHGTPVRRSGVRIGEVQNVHLDNVTGQVTARILVEQPYFLQRTDQVAVIRSLLGGDTALDFQAEPGEEAQPGTEFVAQQPGQGKGPAGPAPMELVPGMTAALKEFNRALEQFNRLLPQVETTVKEYRDLGKEARSFLPDVKRTNEEFQAAARNWSKAGENVGAMVTSSQERLLKSLDNLNDGMVRLSRMLSDDNQKSFTESLKNFQAGTAQLEPVMKNVDTFVKESRQLLQRADQSAREMNVVIANLQQASQPWAERGGSIAKNLDESSAGLNRLVAELRQLFRLITEGDSTLKLLLSDTSLYVNLSDVACMLTRIMPRLDRVMRDMEIFADKIARHPEVLGVDGVLRPSTGLKK